jgi:hypothetical protein
VFFQVGANSTATITRTKYSDHSRSGEVNNCSWCSKSKIDRTFDKARSHTAAAAASQKFMEENWMIKAFHPPYSSDLAPSDFYLFGYVKHCLRGQSFETADKLFSSIEAVWMDIKKSTLNPVFLEWIEKFKQCNATNGNHFEDT